MFVPTQNKTLIKWGNSSPRQCWGRRKLCEFEASLDYAGRLSQREGVYVCEILLFKDGTFNESKFSTSYQWEHTLTKPKFIFHSTLPHSDYLKSPSMHSFLESSLTQFHIPHCSTLSKQSPMETALGLTNFQTPFPSFGLFPEPSQCHTYL